MEGGYCDASVGRISVIVWVGMGGGGIVRMYWVLTKMSGVILVGDRRRGKPVRDCRDDCLGRCWPLFLLCIE